MAQLLRIRGMIMSRVITLSSLLAIVFILSPRISQAAILDPGGAVDMTDRFIPPTAPPAELKSYAHQAFSLGDTGVWHGWVNTWVYANDPNNTMGGYTYVYQIVPNNDTIDNHWVSDMSVSTYAGVGSVNVGQDFSGVSSDGAWRTDDGVAIDFLFQGVQVRRYNSSSLLIVYTDSTQSMEGTAILQNDVSGNTSVTVPAWVDTSSVPLPAAALGGGIMLVSLAIGRRVCRR